MKETNYKSDIRTTRTRLFASIYNDSLPDFQNGEMLHSYAYIIYAHKISGVESRKRFHRSPKLGHHATDMKLNRTKVRYILRQHRKLAYFGTYEVYIIYAILINK